MFNKSNAHRWLFDAWASACLVVKLGHKQPMVRPAVVGSGDGMCDEDVYAIPLSGD